MMSPENILQGRPKPDMSKEIISFGAYAMLYTKNIYMKGSSFPSIVLLNFNYHGGHHFLLLSTGKHIHGYEWHKLPVYDDVIDRV